MSRNLQFALVVPALREASNLCTLLEQVGEALGPIQIPYEILVVDDDSHDGTEDLVNAIAEEDSRVRLLVRKNERGLAGAILHGWQNTGAEILGVMDADLQHPPEVLPKLLAEVLSGHDLAIASRHVEGGTLGGWNPLRKTISAAAIWLTRPLQPAGRRVSDPMSGYFVVRRRCVERVRFQPAGFKLLLEILVRGNVRSVCEVPFAFGRRPAGSSKASLRVAWDYLTLLAKLYAEKSRRARMAEETAAD